MLPEDLQDLVLAFVLLVILVVIGIGLGVKEDRFAYEDSQLRDGEVVFLLNFLRAKIGDKSVSDLIILGENDGSLRETLEKEIREIGYFDSDREYGLRIRYDNENFVDVGCTYEIEEKGVSYKISSLGNGLIDLKFSFQGDECLKI